MRITKVSLDNSPILFERDSNEGFLTHKEEPHKAEKIAALLKKKKESFILSIKNKTLIKRPRNHQKNSDSKFPYYDDIEKIIDCILTKHIGEGSSDNSNNTMINKRLKNTKKSNIEKYLGPKFQTKISYWESAEDKKSGKVPIQFDFALDLEKTLENNSDITKVIEGLSNYGKWAKWYFDYQVERFVRSIAGNKIINHKKEASLEQSNATQVLDQLSTKLINRANIFQNLADDFKLKEITAAWNKEINNHLYKEQDYNNDLKKHEEILRSNPKDKKNKEPDKKQIDMVFKEPFDFRRALKSALQKHQSGLHKAGKFNTPKSGELLNVYSEEITKYLDRYFPLKKSDRNKDRDQSVEYSKSACYYLKLETVRTRVEQQLTNRVMLHLLQKGKHRHYKLDQKELVTSADLQQIQIKEAFVLQFINACAFATNNLRNAIDPAMANDILGGKELREALTKCLNKGDSREENSTKTQTEISQNLAQFFFTMETKKENGHYQVVTNHQTIKNHLNDKNEHSKAFLNFIATVRGAIQQIRNCVIHFNQTAFTDILAIKEIEGFTWEIIPNNEGGDNAQVNSMGDQPIDNALLKTLFKEELEAANRLYAEKIKSAGLFNYYRSEDITQLASFTLFTKPLSFVPGFKRVFKTGRKYIKNQIGLKLNEANYFEKPEIETSEEDCSKENAQYNALNLLYDQHFVKEFTTNEELFSKTVDEVLSANKNYASCSKNKNAYAFNEVPSFTDWQTNIKPKKKGTSKTSKTSNENISNTIIPFSTTEADKVRAYLMAAQSLLMGEESKKRAAGDLKESETGHFQNFLWQLFTKGFDTYLLNSKWNFIKEGALQITDKTRKNRADKRNQLTSEFIEKIRIDTSHGIDLANPAHIAFWTFGKMLDNRHLNELSNQLSKLAQANVKGVVSADDKNLYTFQSILALNILTADHIPNHYSAIYPDKNSALASLTPYITLSQDELKREANLYVQEESPILFAPIELAKRYATEELIRNIINKNPALKVDRTNIDSYKKEEKEAPEWTQQRDGLHKEWADSQNKKSFYDKKEKKQITGWLDIRRPLDSSKSNSEYYECLCEKLDNYNWLNNKVHLNHIRSLHHLIIDILGRFAGFVALFERDFVFLNHAYSSCNTQLSDDDKRKITDNNLDIRRVPDTYKNFLYHNFLSPDNTEWGKNNNDNSGSWKDKRNYIAHFNYLTKTGNRRSILELLSDLRSLVGYDRKLKNAVAKSFITLLDRHGIEIAFKPLHSNSHQFVIEKITSKEINHLGGAIKKDQVHTDYVVMVKALLEYKS